jgi:hypothetical protein
MTLPLEIPLRLTEALNHRPEFVSITIEFDWRSTAPVLIHFGWVGMPCAQGIGKYKAIHFTSVRDPTLLTELTSFSPVPALKESLR